MVGLSSCPFHSAHSCIKFCWGTYLVVRSVARIWTYFFLLGYIIQSLPLRSLVGSLGIPISISNGMDWLDHVQKIVGERTEVMVSFIIPQVWDVIKSSIKIVKQHCLRISSFLFLLSFSPCTVGVAWWSMIFWANTKSSWSVSYDFVNAARDG